MRNEYVAGFLFKPGQVALIEKQKPDWQRGQLNGIGGKIEEGETPLQAMYREFREETCVAIGDWRYFAKVSGDDWAVHFFECNQGSKHSLASPTDEHVDWFWVKDLPHLPVLPNLRWLIPLALDRQVVVTASE